MRLYCYIFVFAIALAILFGKTSSTSVNATYAATRSSKQLFCGLRDFQCGSGECIDGDLYCDGKPHCSDNSDETERCLVLLCASFHYRCKYGACIYRTARCNGTEECFDGSDEAGCSIPPETSTDTPIQNRTTLHSCKLPKHPKNGKYNFVGNTTIDYKEDDSVDNFSWLTLKCNSNYKAVESESRISFCLDGEWHPALSKCARTCKSIKDSETTSAICTFNGKPLESCENPIDGTLAKLSCNIFYESTELTKNPLRICKDGSWDFPPPQCSLVCGTVNEGDLLNVPYAAKRLKYPWHITIYDEQKIPICVGSIINERTILSAAHCFTNSNGALKSKELYTIAAGKYYRDFNDTRDNQAQYSKIKEIFVPDRYKGDLSSYSEDIAVVILQTKLELSIVVQPVCIDWINAFEYQQLSENNKGLTFGWSGTEEIINEPKHIESYEYHYIEYSTCFENIPTSFRKYLSHDKICAEHLNQSSIPCGRLGTGGAALVFRYIDGKYYIRGVASVSPYSDAGKCNAESYVTYTLISRHIDFIRNKVYNERGQ